VSGRLLLDTSAVVDLLAGREAVQRLLDGARELFVSTITFGELFVGARKSMRTEANLLQIETFASAVAVLACELETARLYGEIKDELRKRGRPLPENDIWIAAVARQHDLRLATRDAHSAK
jgi:tRNA(fMet)-specific endonuclease VapC